MTLRKMISLLAFTLLLLTLVACGSVLEAATVAVEQTRLNAAVEETTAVQPITLPAEISQVNENAAAANSQTHDDEQDHQWDDTGVTEISLNGGGMTVSGEGVTVDGNQATITAGGAYQIRGSLDDGQIIVDTADEEIVQLILNGATIHNTAGAPLVINNAEEVVIILADGSQNFLSDAAAYTFASAEEDEPNAALFSKADLTIYGSGSLTVTGNYNDGIASKDGLVIAGGVIAVTAVDDGIRGKDYLVVEDGSLTITAQGDGLKADNEEDASKGYIAIEAGVFHITSGGDAVQAQTDVLISGGEFTLLTGGGSNGRLAETDSAKGIKGVVNVNIDGGTFAIDAADDAVHSNGSLVVNGGAFVITSGDDGMHADASLTINAGSIHISHSYEGIESAVITINGGDIAIVSNDDGLNVAGGVDGSGMNMGPGFGGGPGGRPNRGGAAPGGATGQDAFTYTGSYYLYINGGTVYIEAAGDGIDVNGAIEMTGGVVVVNGPTEQMNGALDYDALFTITGGFFVAAGSAGMAQAPGAASTQPSLRAHL